MNYDYFIFTYLLAKLSDLEIGKQVNIVKDLYLASLSDFSET
jgi:hypothetical protein